MVPNRKRKADTGSEHCLVFADRLLVTGDAYRMTAFIRCLVKVGTFCECCGMRIFEPLSVRVRREIPVRHDEKEVTIPAGPAGQADTSGYWVPSLDDPVRREVFRRESQAQEILFGDPHPRLRGCVLGYAGGQGVNTPLSHVQRVPPEGSVMLIISFGPSPRRLITLPAKSPMLPQTYVVGLHDHAELVEQTGPSAGVLVTLTPPGAYALFGAPMRELTNRYTALADLCGRAADRLAEELAHAPDWSARFSVLDRYLAHWLRLGRTPDSAVFHAWRRLQRSSGTLPIGRLATELGCSRRYLEKKFREQVGVTPKTVARICRFQRAAHLLTEPHPHSFSHIAQMCGYADQAHLNLDFRSLAGCTPTQLLHARPQALDTRADDLRRPHTLLGSA